jgi:chromosome partitioning protein
MENRIVLFSNIKGGVGKTTLCALFASYLVEKGIPVFAMDADLQASLYRHRQREKDADPDAPAPWAVEMLDTSNGQKLEETISKLKNVPGIVLIDCPGNLNDRNLEHIYRAADVAVIPMSYDADTIDATGIFVKAFKTISPAKLIFVPNRINTSEGKAEELRQRTQTTEILGLIGTVTPRIKQSVVVKRYTTLYPLDRYQSAAVEHPFDRIINELNIKE